MKWRLWKGSRGEKEEKMKTRYFTLSVTLAITVALVVCFSSVSALAVDSKTLELAKQEGKVVWYTTMPGSAWKAIEAAFEKKYPSIDLEVLKAGSLDIIGRYRMEVAAGRSTADCIHITDMVFFLDMMKKGNLTKYDSPEFKAYSGLPDGWVYPGYIVPLRVMPIAALVNTKVVDWKSIKSYDDMLKPEFKGAIASGNVATSTRAYLNYYGLRGKYGVGWYKKLVDLDAQYYESSEKAMTQAFSGEWPILFEAWVYKDYQGRVLKKGPIHSVFPKEGSVVVPAPNTIMKQGRHQNAAKVFQDFVYSREAQVLLGKKIGVHSGRNDVSAPPGMPSLKEMNIIDVDFVDAANKREELVAEWQKITGR